MWVCFLESFMWLLACLSFCHSTHLGRSQSHMHCDWGCSKQHLNGVQRPSLGISGQSASGCPHWANHQGRLRAVCVNQWEWKVEFYMHILIYHDISIYIYIIIYCISFGVWLEHIPVTFGHFGARFCCHQAPIRGLRSSTSTECHWAAPPHRLVGSTLGATQQGKDQNCLKTHLLDGFREKNVHPGPIL